MTVQQPSQTELADWATPESWKKTEEIVDRAESNYRKLAQKLNLVQTHFRQFIIISSENPEMYVIGTTEVEADELWRARGSSHEDAAIFQIGNI